MHRQTPLTAGFVGYTSGGARTLIDTIDDATGMQQMKGSIMGESREKVECPQNYGFSSVVRPGTKGQDGKISDGAEGFMSYFGGSRSSNFCAVMDDRRYRPLGMKPGENAQYDDVGQMTLIRRSGVYVLSNDNQEDNQQGGAGGGAGGGGAGTLADSGSGGSSGGQQTERFVSIRHVEKKKQQRPNRGGGGGQGGGGGGGGGASAGTTADSGSSGGAGGQQQDYKHEGDTVNHEVRVSKKRIEFRCGDKVVGYYEKESDTWYFTGKLIHNKATEEVKDEAPKISHN